MQLFHEKYHLYLKIEQKHLKKLKTEKIKVTSAKCFVNIDFVGFNQVKKEFVIESHDSQPLDFQTLTDHLNKITHYLHDKMRNVAGVLHTIQWAMIFKDKQQKFHKSIGERIYMDDGFAGDISLKTCLNKAEMTSAYFVIKFSPRPRVSVPLR